MKIWIVAWGGSHSCPITGTIQKPEIILKKAVCSKIKYKIRVKLFLTVNSMKVDTTMTSDFESALPLKPKKARYQSFFTVGPLKGLKLTISGLNGWAWAMSKYDVTMHSFVNFYQVFSHKTLVMESPDKKLKNLIDENFDCWDFTSVWRRWVLWCAHWSTYLGTNFAPLFGPHTPPSHKTDKNPPHVSQDFLFSF